MSSEATPFPKDRAGHSNYLESQWRLEKEEKELLPEMQRGGGYLNPMQAL